VIEMISGYLFPDCAYTCSVTSINCVYIDIAFWFVLGIILLLGYFFGEALLLKNELRE